MPKIDRDELYQLWQDNKDRPAWVRQHASELSEHTNTSEPIPTNGSLFDVRQWLKDYKGTVTRQLNDDADGTDPQDTDGEDGGNE